MALIVRSSQIHAAGCYTTTRIRKDAFIVEYTGERISKDLADERYEHRDHTYLFGVGDGRTVIDGFGTAMFLNHSCAPNCETDEVDGRIWIIALRDIKPGEELTYDYCLYDGEPGDEAPCSCGAKQCRGTMYSDDEVARQKRELKKRESEQVA